MTGHHVLAPSPAGSVVLDIGPGTGALVLHAEAAELGDEIEISESAGTVRVHSAVRERRLGDRSVYCAIYPNLGAGDYVVWHSDNAPAATATVTEGRVTELPLADRRRTAAAPAL